MLAHLDGELPTEEDAEVSAHLKSCWRCRASLADLERQALVLAKALEADTFPGPQRVAEARSNLAEWQEEFEREVGRFPQFSLLGGRVLRRVAWGAGIAGCLAAAIWVSQPVPPARFVMEPARETAAPNRDEQWKALPEPPEIDFPGRITPPMPLFRPPAPVDLRLLEIEAYYGLHRFRACLGMPIEISLDPPGCVTIRGLVTSPEQRDRLEATFTQLRSPGCFRLDVKTVREAASERPGDAAAYPAEAAPVEVVGGNLPLQAQLEAYFAQQADGRTAGSSRRVADLANQAVMHVDQLLAEAWALRRLAERFGEPGLGRLPAPAAWLLEIMVRDHLQAVREQRARLHDLLGPPLAFVAADRGVEPIRQVSPPGSDAPAWHAALLPVFHSAQQMRRSVVALFARASSREERQHPVLASEAPTATAVELLGWLRESEQEVSMAAQALAADFSDRPDVRAYHNPPE